jgi:hypothetical protein
MGITREMWEIMAQSIAKECKDLDDNKTGVSVVLWKLRSLMDGYKYALDHGYVPHDERETNP